MGEWLKERLREKSTWRGVVLLLSSAGLVSPVGAEAVVSVVVALLGAVDVLVSERKSGQGG